MYTPTFNYKFTHDLGSYPNKARPGTSRISFEQTQERETTSTTKCQGQAYRQQPDWIKLKMSTQLDVETWQVHRRQRIITGRLTCTQRTPDDTT